MASQAKFGNPANYNASPATRSDGDASSLEVDSKGNLLVNLGVALSLLVNNLETDTIGVAPFRRGDAFQASVIVHSASAVQIQAATVSKSIYITDLLISTDGGAACTLILQDNAGTPNIIVNKINLPASVVTVSHHFAVPKKLVSGNELDALCSSASPNVTVDVVGYVI